MNWVGSLPYVAAFCLLAGGIGAAATYLYQYKQSIDQQVQNSKKEISQRDEQIKISERELKRPFLQKQLEYYF